MTKPSNFFSLAPQSPQRPSQGSPLDLSFAHHDVARTEEDWHPQPIIPGQSVVPVDIDLLDRATDARYRLLDDRPRLVAKMTTGPDQESEG